MYSFGGRLLNLNAEQKLPGADAVLHLQKWQYELRSIQLLGAFCVLFAILGMQTANAGYSFSGSQHKKTPHKSSFFGNKSQRAEEKEIILVQNIGSSGNQDDSSWTSWPQWQGLPNDHFIDGRAGAVTDETIDQVAQQLYDRAYTQFLVGDLRSASQGFTRVINHYSQSSVAHKARMALAKVYSRKNIKNNLENKATSNTGFNILGSSIQQLSIISLSGDFTAAEENIPAGRSITDLAMNTSSNGTKDDFLLNVGDRVFFAKRSASLTDEAKKLLTAQAEWLKANRNYKLLIEGHADEEGPDHYNMVLSANRALSVQQFFLNKEIDPGRIRTKHFGKSKPVAICKKEKCSVQNRRAVTKLLPESAN